MRAASPDGARDRETNKMAGSPTALQYLDKAVGSLRQLGLFPEKKGDPAPVVALLNQITELSPDKVTTIARTLDQASMFNEVVREHISAIKVGERYETITNGVQLDPRRRQGPRRAVCRRQDLHDGAAVATCG